MRKHYYLLAALILLIIAFVPMVKPAKERADPKPKELSAEEKQKRVRSKVPGVKLYQCADGGLGIKFLCDFGWHLQKGDHSLVYTIGSVPEVKLKIAKIDIDILFIHQLSRDSLKAIGEYQEGFVLEELKVAGLNAIKVKAFASDNSEIRLSDYYFVRDKILYAMMFSVTPKDRWGDYQFLIEDIVNSLEFR